MADASMLHADLAALVGAMLHDRYRVDSLLGSGGMGAVFKGHHVGLDRDVAIKVLHPEFGRDPSVGKRFEREATSASRLDHPNCVRVTDFGTTETGTTYLVMELLSGTELKDRLGQPWAPQAMIATAKQMLAGLEHAHHFGIVHRDLKPENVYVTKDYRGEEVVKLVDFGIAKLLDEQGIEKLTRQGVVFGTPRYMSPEQAAGGKIDERTDLYAAGLIFYEMLAGHGPFEAEDTAAVLRMQIMAPPPPLPDSVPAPLAKVIEKLLEKSKADRYAHARDVIAALDEVTAALISSAAASDSLARVRASGPAAARSGAAWQPAPAVAASAAGSSPTVSTSTPTRATGGHQTLAYDGSGYVATRTGSHMGVGQMSTGQYESLASHAAMAASLSWTGSHETLPAQPEPSGAGVSRPAPVVTVEPIERRPPPSVRRSWVPWALAGSAIAVALAGMAVVVSLFLIDGAAAVDEPTVNPAAEAATKAGDTQSVPDRPIASPVEQPAPGPIRTTSPTGSTAGRSSSGTGSRSSSTTPAKKPTDDPVVEPVGPTDEPTIIEVVDPTADTKPTPITDPPSGPTDTPDGTEPTGDTQPSGDAAELAKREAQRGKGSEKGKGKGKDK